ncbi:hypothetical protein Scep_005865 [Stephania cephalantha]|uniref:Cytochrome P450 n=1 Tax=Stephania cephalantha TaxID=152367 RepID=A0AAP0KV52_9MAGN
MMISIFAMVINTSFTPLLFLSLLFLIFMSKYLFLIMMKTSTTSTSATPLPPGPIPWPIVGNLPELVKNKPRFRWISSLVDEANNAGIACIRLGGVHVILVKCPVIAREFLKKHDAVFASRPITMATHYSSRGFLSVVDAPLGEQWKKMRRLVASEVLSHARLKWLLHKRVEEADNLVRHIYSQCCHEGGASVVNVRSVAWHYSGNVIRKMMFNRRYFGDGREDGGPGFEEEEYVGAIVTVLFLLNAFCVSDYMPCLRWLDLDGHEKQMKRAISIVNKYHDPIIDERIKSWRESTSSLDRTSQDLLDVLILAKNSNEKPLLSVEEIKAQVADLVYAAIDNPSNAAEWALAEMMGQPQILTRAVDEIDRVVGKERLVQESDLSQLNYVRACAREAFRLHPIAPFNVPHVSVADVNVAGYFIPKGSHVLLSRVGLGRNPKVWDDPTNFKPERHLGHGSSKPVQLSEPELRFISFSAGRRACMGTELGTEMTVMLLARLLQGFTWTLPRGVLTVDLSESKEDLCLAKQLFARKTTVGCPCVP